MSTYARVFIVSSRRRSHKVIKRRSPSVPQPEQRHRRRLRVPRLGLRRRDSRRWRPPRRARGHPPLPPEPTRARAEKRERVRRGRLFRRTAVFEILPLYEGRLLPFSKAMALLTPRLRDLSTSPPQPRRTSVRAARPRPRGTPPSPPPSPRARQRTPPRRDRRDRSLVLARPGSASRASFFFCVSTVLSLPVSVSSPQSPPRTTARRSRPRPRPRARRRPFAPRSAVFKTVIQNRRIVSALLLPREARREQRVHRGGGGGLRSGAGGSRTLSPRPRRARPAPRAMPWARVEVHSVRGPFAFLPRAEARRDQARRRVEGFRSLRRRVSVRRVQSRRRGADRLRGGRETVSVAARIGGVPPGPRTRSPAAARGVGPSAAAAATAPATARGGGELHRGTLRRLRFRRSLRLRLRLRSARVHLLRERLPSRALFARVIPALLPVPTGERRPGRASDKRFRGIAARRTRGLGDSSSRRPSLRRRGPPRHARRSSRSRRRRPPGGWFHRQPGGHLQPRARPAWGRSPRGPAEEKQGHRHRRAAPAPRSRACQPARRARRERRRRRAPPLAAPRGPPPAWA